MTGNAEFEEWLRGETRVAAGALLAAVSATHLVMDRPGFGQRIAPRTGSVLASPVVAHYDPNPDYFFHWFRDAAVVTDALRVALAEGYLGDPARLRFLESVQFALELRAVDGAQLVRGDFRSRVLPQYLQYVRSDAELASVSGAAVAGDVRVNADGSLDLARWGRPQVDGPALRALDALRWWRNVPLAGTAQTAELIRSDLAFTLTHAGKPCFDVWEEERGMHFYTLLLQGEVLIQGSKWLEERGDQTLEAECRRLGASLLAQLPAFWDAGAGFYRSRSAVTDARTDGGRRELDITIVIAVLHAGRASGEFSVLDPKVQATLTALEELFEGDYAINQHRGGELGPALGRYANDRYYSGGAYYFATLAAAEFYYKLAAALRPGAALAPVPENARFRDRLGTPDEPEHQPAALIARGDAILRTVRRFTPATGELSEQFDQRSGEQTSARRLSWSYAAFVTAVAARARARGATPG